MFLSASLNLNAADATDKIKVFFNQPEALTSSEKAQSEIANPDIGIDEVLIDFIDAASSGDTLYACLYEIDRTAIETAFNNADARGVNVYVISDDPDGNTAEYANLTTINKILGNSSAIMHNKFVVLKDSAVWSGSYNTTDNGTTGNNNNAVLVYSDDLADIFEGEFLYMWDGGAGKFSTDKTTSPYTNQEVTVGSTTINVYFSPYTSVDTNTSVKLAKLISEATDSILFNMFTCSVNETRLKGAVIDAFNDGLEVKGVVDAGQSSSIQNAFRSLGMDVVLDANDGKLHHKFCVIDYGTSHPKVVTGSYNWTNQANEVNDENFLVIHSREVADLYWEEFQKNYALAAGNISNFTEESVRDALVYPSPAKDVDEVTIGYELSPAVTEVEITIYTLYGEKVKSFNLKQGEFYPGTYNEKIWNLQNDSSDDVAPGLYIIKVEGDTGDGTVYDTSKFAVIR